MTPVVTVYFCPCHRTPLVACPGGWFCYYCGTVVVANTAATTDTRPVEGE